MRAIVFASSLVLTLELGSAPAAFADTAQQSAARTFHDGERAFAEGDYRRAASLFEEAYAVRPHPSSLWNAAQAHERAGDRVHAAKLYAKLLREAGSSTEASDARSSLETLTAQLGRIRIHAAAEIRDRSIDGAVVEQDETVFVEPGLHAVEGASDNDAVVRKDVDVPAGALVTVSLAAVSLLPRSADPSSVSPRPPRQEPPEPATARHGIAPIFFVAAGAVTLAAGGATVWSGLDVSAQRRRYEQTSSDADFAAGQEKQLRTNVLLAVTAGLAIITGVTALVTDFRSPVLGPSARLRVVVGGADGIF